MFQVQKKKILWNNNILRFTSTKENWLNLFFKLVLHNDEINCLKLKKNYLKLSDHILLYDKYCAAMRKGVQRVFIIRSKKEKEPLNSIFYEAIKTASKIHFTIRFETVTIWYSLCIGR